MAVMSLLFTRKPPCACTSTRVCMRVCAHVKHTCLHACVCTRANTITSVFSISKETLRKFQAWGQAKAELAEQKAQAEKEAILAQGGDAFKHLCHQRRRQELEAEKR